MPDDAERSFFGIEEISHSLRIDPVMIRAPISCERRCFHRDGVQFCSCVLHKLLAFAVDREKHMHRLIVAEIRVEEAHQHVWLLRRYIPFPVRNEHEAPVIDAVDV